MLTAKGELYRGLQAWSGKYLNGHADRAKAESRLLQLFEAYENSVAEAATGPERDLADLERLAKGAIESSRCMKTVGGMQTLRIAWEKDHYRYWVEDWIADNETAQYDGESPHEITRAEALALLEGAKE